MDLKLLLLALVVSSAHHRCSKVEAAAKAPAANNNFLSEATTLGSRNIDVFQATKTDDCSSKVQGKTL